MSQVINTNVLSLTAQRNLQTSQSELATSLQRLSSGLRINSAKDDAAGLAISERFTTQIRGLNQAIRNSNDGISLAQTGEAALATVTDNLQRIRELAVQSVNATNSDTDRATLQQEVTQRLNEIDRISSQTSFNGRNVLDGSFGSAQFQVGANVGDTIGLNLTDSNVRASAIGKVAEAKSVDLSTLIVESADAVTTVPSSTGELGAFAEASEVALVGGSTYSFELSADGATSITASEAVADGGNLTAANVAAEIDSAFGTATDGKTVNGFTIDFGTSANITDAVTDGTLSFSRADGVEITITQTVSGDIFNSEVGFDNLKVTGDPLVGTVNAPPTENTEQSIDFTTDNGTEGVIAKPLTLATNDLTLQLGDSDAVAIAAGVYASNEALVDAINVALGSNATARLVTDENNVETISIVSGDAITVVDAKGVFGGGQTFTTGGSLDIASVETVTDANAAIQRIDSALSSVSELRSTFGAIQNRFESTIENLTTTTENLQASRSRILDADFAAETANLTRVQILQQAGISVLSQANVQPQNVLALLQ